MTRIDRYSLAVVPIEQLFNEESLGNATGFIWRRGERFYLVTNWHVITCRHFPTGENLHNQGARPNRLRAFFNVGLQQFGKQEHLISIRDEDARPQWLVHSGRRVDVAVLPLPYDGKDPVFALNPINGTEDPDLFVGVGMDCFILGYPFGVVPPGYPVWKRGSIASEPDLIRMTGDHMLVDTASRPGMSGAPVIVRTWGYHLLDDGGTEVDEYARSRFVGIYSGRLAAQPMEAQIGMVWGGYLIDEIIAGGQRDKD